MYYYQYAFIGDNGGVTPGFFLGDWQSFLRGKYDQFIGEYRVCISWGY